MPNHWKTRIIFKNKSDIHKVQKIFHDDYEMCQDVMPRPEILNHTNSPNNGMYIIDYPENSFIPNERPFTQAELDEIVKTGYDNWYDWSNANWGTKWGIYDIKIISNGVEFSSAWCPPNEKIFELFAKKYGFNSFEVVGHDEGVSRFESIYSIDIEKE